MSITQDLNPGWASQIFSSAPSTITTPGNSGASGNVSAISGLASYASSSAAGSLTAVPNVVSFVVLNPSMSAATIYAVIANNPVNTKFSFLPGTYPQLTIQPKSGQVFDGHGWGTVLDGQGVAQFAFLSTTANNVTAQGFTIQNYTTPQYSGTIMSFFTNGWLIQNNFITNNGGAAIASDSGARVLNNILTNNLQEGFAAHGNNVVYQGNEIAFNNLNFIADASQEAGGGKGFNLSNAVFKNNYVHDNGGNGIWCDTNCIYITYDSNRVVNNWGAGIYHEISYDATITNNYVALNGMPSSPGGGQRLKYFWDSGIQLRRSGALTAATPILISGNLVVNNYNGIGMLETPKGLPNAGEAGYGPNEIKNILVLNNTVFQPGQGQLAGIVQDGAGDYVFGQNILFQGNTYYVPYQQHPNDGYAPGWFTWKEAWFDYISVWQGQFPGTVVINPGNDVNGNQYFGCAEFLSATGTVSAAYVEIVMGTTTLSGTGSAGTTPYRLFSANGPAVATTYSGPLVIGVSFEVTYATLPAVYLQGYWWWVCNSGQPTAPQKFALWTRSSATAGTYVSSSVVTSGTLIAGQWNFVPTTLTQLTSGTEYVAVTGFLSGPGFPLTVNQFGATEPYAAGITSGPLLAYSSTSGSAPDAFSSPQEVFGTSGTDPTVSFPNQGFQDGNFYMDVQVTY